MLTLYDACTYRDLHCRSCVGTLVGTHSVCDACTYTDLYCQRASLSSGQDILELGCGWGSFSLFAAAKYPASSVTAVSNSRTQREFIEARAKERGLKNLKVYARFCVCVCVECRFVYLCAYMAKQGG